MTDGGLKKYDWRRRLRGGGYGVYSCPVYGVTVNTQNLQGQGQ